jgi:hypothetical protein
MIMMSMTLKLIQRISVGKNQMHEFKYTTMTSQSMTDNISKLIAVLILLYPCNLGEVVSGPVGSTYKSNCNQNEQSKPIL